MKCTALCSFESETGRLKNEAVLSGLGMDQAGLLHNLSSVNGKNRVFKISTPCLMDVKRRMLQRVVPSSSSYANQPDK